jgi:predicted dehydrogenase
LVAHGSQVIDQVRVTCGEVVAVSAARLAVGGHPMSADDGFIIELRLASGGHAVLTSTASERGWPIIETRVAGTKGTAWIAGIGADVFVADADGTRQVAVPEDLVTIAPEPPPAEALRSAYDRMVGHGLDLGPYTRLATVFGDRIRGVRSAPGPEPATFVDGVADMAVLDAARASATKGGAWIDVAHL